jgi:hypothetical protein
MRLGASWVTASNVAAPSLPEHQREGYMAEAMGRGGKS